MITKYIAWAVPNHPRGVASFKEFIGGRYGWLTCSEPLYGSETENKYISMFQYADDKDVLLSAIIESLSQWRAKEISPKLATMYARKYNPAFIDFHTQIQYGYPYLDVDAITIKRDITHVAYDTAMQDEDVSEQAKLDIEKTEMGMIRVVEDLIDVLIAKNTILFTDLPVSVQGKITTRKTARTKVK